MTTRKRNGLGVIIALLMLSALVLAACGAGAATPTTAPAATVPVVQATPQATAPATAKPVATTQPTAKPAAPVTLRVATGDLMVPYNPLSTWNGWAQRLWVYNGLFGNDGDAITPRAAESWTVAADGLTWTFKLKKGMTYHDGSPFTAEDAAWGLSLVRDNKLGVLYISDVSNFKEITAVDKETLKIVTSTPMAEGAMKYALTTWLLPKSVWGTMTPDQMMQYNDIKAAIGTGPYKLVDSKEGEYDIFEAYTNPVWGKPAIDRIEERFYATTDPALEALIADKVDVVQELPFTSVPRLLKEKNIKVEVLDTMLVQHLIINSNENGKSAKSLADPLMRKAIEMVMDKQKIVDVAFLGYATPLDSLLPTTMGKWQNTDLKIKYDVEAAKKLLEQAGYVDKNGDGIREDAAGKPLTYRLYGVDDPTRIRTQEIVNDGLKDLGIKVDSQTMGWDGIFAAVGSYDYDIIVLSFNWSPEPTMPLGIFTCSQREGGANEAGYCDKAYDQMFTQQAQALDEAQRLKIVWDMQKKLFDDRPFIMLCTSKRVDAYRSDHFTGFGTTSGYIMWEAALMKAKPVK